MIKKYLILITAILTIFSFGFVSASEVTGNFGTQLETGITGVLKSAPVFSPDAGTYNENQSVTLSAPGSTSICYTVNGDTPACSGYNACSTGTKYTGAISVESTTSIKAIACYADGTAGPVSTSQTYTLVCAISSVANGTVSAYPGCVITCNSGYTKSGNTCVASSSGVSGGSYTPPPATPPTTTPPPAAPTTPEINDDDTDSTTPTSPSAASIPGLNLPYANPTTPAEIKANREVLLKYLVALILSLSSSSTPTTPTTPAVPSTPTTPTIPTTPSTIGPFNETLSFGMRNDEVRQLQEFLVSQGSDIYPEGLVTGYFGDMTLQAVGRFQIANGIVNSASDSGYGVVGPRTRAKINSILGY